MFGGEFADDAEVNCLAGVAAHVLAWGEGPNLTTGIDPLLTDSTEEKVLSGPVFSHQDALDRVVVVSLRAWRGMWVKV